MTKLNKKGLKKYVLTKELSKGNKLIHDKGLANPLDNGFLANNQDKLALDNWLKPYIIGFNQRSQCPNFGDII